MEQEGRPIEALEIIRTLTITMRVDQASYPDMTVQEAEAYERSLSIGEVVDLLDFPDEDDYTKVSVVATDIGYDAEAPPLTMTTEIKRIYADAPGEADSS